MSTEDRSRNQHTVDRRVLLLASTTLVAATAFGSATPVQMAQAQQQASTPGRKPNILCYLGRRHRHNRCQRLLSGPAGFPYAKHRSHRPRGDEFTDYYGEQSCTADRATFITGQSVFRTGNSKVGLPGAATGLQKEDPTIAELLKPLGYATGQFGKNHLVTVTSFCRQYTGSTSSMATCTT